MAFCDPSGCGTAPLPMKSPGLMSASEAFSTSTTSILSARLSLSSSPLSDFANTVWPSTFSMTPRRRTVCGACAMAGAAARAARKAMPAITAFVLMSCSDRRCVASLERTPFAPTLHRRIDAVAAYRNARGLERAVSQRLRADNENLRAGLQISHRRRRKQHDHDVRRHNKCLLAVLVFQNELLAIGNFDFTVDVGVGHGAVRDEVPRPMAFAGATQGFGEDVAFHGLLGTVRLRHGGDADEFARLDVGERFFDDRPDHGVVGDFDLHHGAVARLHVQDWTG